MTTDDRIDEGTGMYTDPQTEAERNWNAFVQGLPMTDEVRVPEPPIVREKTMMVRVPVQYMPPGNDDIDVYRLTKTYVEPGYLPHWLSSWLPDRLFIREVFVPVGTIKRRVS